MKIKHILILVITGSLLMLLAGCVNKSTKADANEIVEAFEQHDINAINTMIFDITNLDIDEELSDYFTDMQEDSGILAQIFAVDTITVKKIDETNKELVYEVKAPDLSGVFSDLSNDAVGMTESDFEQYLSDYIQSADIITTSVSVSYTYDGKDFSANYKTPEFINAITGGLLNAYQSLYQEMVNEYLQEMEDAE